MWTSFLVLALSSLPDDGAVERGRALYLDNCARCHGREGHGDTELKLTPPPRNFREGKFSFGNTKDALFNTVSSGIPGTAMISFEETLNEQDRRLVVDYVRTLIPEQSARDRSSVVLVQKTAKVVRGYLPWAGHDLPLSRGLMIGLPGGLCFAYRTDDVRLLRVLRGGFVDRAEWEGRGGTPLVLLGDPFCEVAREDGAPAFGVARGAACTSLLARLVATSVEGATAGLEYELREASGARVARVVERLEAETVTGAPGFSRRFTIKAEQPRTRLVLDVIGRDGAAPPRTDAARGPLVTPHWLTIERGDGQAMYLMLAFPAGAEMIDPFTVAFDAAPEPLEVRIATFVASASPEELARLKEEVGR
jgi:mono/diheme cytochrome c family protein